MRAREFITDSVINGVNNLTKHERLALRRRDELQAGRGQELRDVENLANNKTQVRKK